MPSHVLYEIPMAAWPIRLVMGAVCLFFVLAIFGFWLPRVIPSLFNLPRVSGGQRAAVVAIAVIPLAIGFGPLSVLMALIRNPIAYVTDAGVMKENVFSATPTRLTWAEIAHVSCHLGRDGAPRWFNLVAADGRQIGFGNTGDADFHAMHELFEDRLGPAVMQGCPRAFRG
jgi:hypothetical protein